MSTKVLVVDDSGMIRKVIVRALGELGIKDVVEAPDGDAAWKSFQEDSFDLVLTDWNMPGKTGLELLQAIRDGGSTIPVVLITTESEKRRVIEAIQAGVSDYVVKPFDKASLREKITKFVPANV